MSKNTVAVSAGNFTKKLSSVLGRTKTMREDLQELLIFGLAHYGASEDTCYLSQCVKACVGVGALDTRKMREYLQDNANIAWTKIEIKSGAKAGQVDHVFKKKGQHAEVTLPDTPWYEFEKAEADKPAKDAITMLVNFRKTLAKEIESNHVTDIVVAKEVLIAIDFDLANLAKPKAVAA